MFNKKMKGMFACILLAFTTGLFVEAQAAIQKITSKSNPIKARDIGVGARGHVWIIGTAKVPGGGPVYRWTGRGWNKISGGGVRIAVDPRGNPWLVNSTNTIFQYLGRNKWKRLPGRATDIGIGPRGQVWIVGAGKNNGPVYRWNGKSWSKISGAGKRIAVDARGNPWVVNSAGQIWQYVGRNKWKKLPGKASDIGVGANGKVWVAGTNAIYSWEGKGWRVGGLKASNLSVDRVGMPWITTVRGEIARITPANVISQKERLAKLRAEHAKRIAAIKKRQQEIQRKRAAEIAKAKRAQAARIAAWKKMQHKPVGSKPGRKSAVDPLKAMRDYNNALSNLSNTLKKVKNLRTAAMYRPDIKKQIIQVNKMKAASNFKDIQLGEKDKAKANQMKREAQKSRQVGSRYKKEATRVMKLRNVGGFLAPTMNQLKI